MKKNLNESYSTDKKYKIIVKYTEAFSFGNNGIYVYYKKSSFSFKKLLFTTELGNDGKTPSKENCTIKWDDNSCYIYLDGEDQPIESYKIEFSKNVTYEKIRDKYDEPYIDKIK